MKITLNDNEILALRNCILPRLVDIEQHGYSEEFEGEGVALRELGNKLERKLKKIAERDDLFGRSTNAGSLLDMFGNQRRNGKEG